MMFCSVGIVKPLTKKDAESNRDSIAKAIYNGLFLWVVKRINSESVSKACEKDCAVLFLFIYLYFDEKN